MELTPENVLAVMREYYAAVTPEQFAADVAAACRKKPVRVRGRRAKLQQCHRDAGVGVEEVRQPAVTV